MRGERGSIGPLLDENQTLRILAIDMHGMRDASRLSARTMDVFETQSANLLESILPRIYAAGHHDHFLPPGYWLIVLVDSRDFSPRHGAASAALADSGAGCGQRFSAARPASVSL